MFCALIQLAHILVEARVRGICDICFHGELYCQNDKKKKKKIVIHINKADLRHRPEIPVYSSTFDLTSKHWRIMCDITATSDNDFADQNYQHIFRDHVTGENPFSVLSPEGLSSPPWWRLICFNEGEIWNDWSKIKAPVSRLRIRDVILSQQAPGCSFLTLFICRVCAPSCL